MEQHISTQYALLNERLGTVRDDLRATKTTLEENANLVRDLISLFREIEKQAGTSEKLTSEFRTRLMSEMSKLADSREKIDSIRVSIHEDVTELRHRLEMLETMGASTNRDLLKVIADLGKMVEQKFEIMDQTVATAVAPLSEIDVLYSDTSESLRLVRAQSGLDGEGKKLPLSETVKNMFWQGGKSTLSNFFFIATIALLFFVIIYFPRFISYLSTAMTKGMGHAG